MTPVRIVFSALLVYAVCTAAGQILLARLKLRLDRAEAWFLAFVTGSALISTVVFLLAAVRRVYPGVLLALAAVAIVSQFVFGGQAKPPSPPTHQPALSTRWRLAFWATYILFGVFYLANAMAPDVSPDGVVYHVGLVARYFDRHGFYPMRTNMFANIPGGAEMLFLFAYAFGRHSAAAVVHLLFLLAMPFAMMAYGRRMGQPLAGIAGALLFYAAPIVGKDGAVAYNDVLGAAIAFGCFYALQIWQQDRQPAMLIPAGLLAGFAFACKYTAFTVVLYAGGFVLFWCWRRREKMWRPMLALALPAAMMILPWLIKSAVYVGNPVHPFFSRIFPNRYYSERLEQDLHDFWVHPNGTTYAQVPWQVTVGGRLDGILGPLFLLAPLSLLSLRSAMGRQLLAAFTVVALAYFGNLSARFLIPPLPFLALALASALALLPNALIAAVAIHVVLSWPTFIDLWAPPNQWRLENFEWRAALRITPEDRFLTEHMRDYRAGLMLDRFVPRGQLVYAPSVGQLAYHRTEIIGSNLSFRVLDNLATGYMNGREKILRRTYTFAAVRTQVLRLVLAGHGDLPWSAYEIRFFRDGREIPRAANWKLMASSSPWDVGLAFDNGPLSAWQSSGRARDGLWIQTDFGAPLDVTSVSVEQLPDEGILPQAIEVKVGDRFQRITATEDREERAFGAGLRRAAAAEIKACGVQWLALLTGDFGEEDLRLRTPYWNAREVAREGEYRLWKLE